MDRNTAGALTFWLLLGCVVLSVAVHLAELHEARPQTPAQLLSANPDQSGPPPQRGYSTAAPPPRSSIPRVASLRCASVPLLTLRPAVQAFTHTATTAAGHHFFANHGFAVWTFDVHGHGASEPFGERDRVAIRQFDHLVADCEQFMNEVVAPWVAELAPGTPVILNGTSMGGLAVRSLLPLS